jgi:hypothetical protein
VEEVYINPSNKKEKGMIQIVTKKEVSDAGNDCRRILSIEALDAKSLPRIYLDSSNIDENPRFFKGMVGYEETLSRCPYDRFLEVGGLYKETDFRGKLEYIRKAGARLKNINRELESRRKAWTGEETFVI